MQPDDGSARFVTDRLTIILRNDKVRPGRYCEYGWILKNGHPKVGMVFVVGHEGEKSNLWTEFELFVNSYHP